MENHAPEAAHSSSSFLTPDVSMLILTWVTFFILLGILYKFAWKPILNAVQAREDSIRKSVEEADQIKAELSRLEETIRAKMDEAQQKAQLIISESKKAAQESAKIFQEKAKEEAQIILTNARREIQEEAHKAQVQLKMESAKVAVALAEKIIRRSMDQEKSKRFIDDLIKEI